MPGHATHAVVAVALSLLALLAVAAPNASAQPRWGEALDLPAERGAVVRFDAEGNATTLSRVRTVGEGTRLGAAVRPAGGDFGRYEPVSRPFPEVGEFDLAVNAQGDAVAVWSVGGSGGRPWIEVSHRPAGGSFEEPVRLSGAAGAAFQPKAAVSASGEAVVVWTEHRPRPAGERRGPFAVQASIRGAGGTWAAARRLSGEQHASRPAVGIDDAGNALVAWEGLSPSGEDVDVFVARRPSGAGTFASAELLSPPGARAGAPELAVAGDGRAVVAWLARVRTSARVRFAHRVQAAAGTTLGGFGRRRFLSRPGASAHSVAIEAGGRAVAAWRRQYDLSARVRYSRVEASLRSAGGSFGRPAFLSRRGLGQLVPDVAVDRSGAAVVVWAWSGDRARGAPRGSQIQAAIAAGRRFAATRAISARGSSFSPRIATDPRGGGIAYWESGRASATNVVALLLEAG